MGGSDKAWQQWGRADAYYGVLSSDEYRGGSIEGTVRDRFFLTGHKLIKSFIDSAGNIKTHNALDFGCGVGRLILPLASVFDNVVGVDISEHAMAEAARNCEAHGYRNVRFVKSDDDLSGVAQKDFDWVQSFICIQHIPRRRGLRIAGRLLDLCGDGGWAVLHFNLRREQSLLRRAAYFARHSVPGGAMLINLLTGRPIGDPPMRMEEYDPCDILELFHKVGFGPVTVTTEFHGTSLTATFMAQRGGETTGTERAMESDARA